MNPWDMSGRSVLITGASSGIGRATAVLLAGLGAKLILVGRNRERLDETARLVGGTAPRVEVFDLEQLAAIPEWIKGLARQEGVLSGLVHSAGVHLAKPLRYLEPERMDQLMRVNVTAAAQLAKGFRQNGVRAAASSVVFLSSVMGLVGQPAVSAYCASKAAVAALARSLALELAAEGIRVNCVAPGIVETEMTAQLEKSLTKEQFAAVRDMHPLGTGQPVDVAHAIAFLLAETGRWVTGSTLVVDGGYTAR